MNPFLKNILIIFIFSVLSDCLFAQEEHFDSKKKENQYAVLFRFDNDLFVGRDDYYSNGLYLGLVKSSNTFEGTIFPDFIGRGLSHLLGLKHKDGLITSGFSFAHRMFTPHDIENPDYVSDDMPYSGQFALSLNVGSQNDKHLDAWTLTLGVTGPVTRAEELQFDVHYSLLAPISNGWDYQLENEALVNVFYEHRYQMIAFGENYKFLDSTLLGSIGLGNLTSFAEIGLALRLGWNIPKDFYAPTSIYGNPMVGILPTKPCLSKFSLYVFGSLNAAYVYNNIALDGNTFYDYSPYIEYDHFGTRLSFGFFVGLSKFHIIFNLAYEPISWENSFGIKEDVYGQLSFVWSF